MLLKLLKSIKKLQYSLRLSRFFELLITFKFDF